MLSYRCTKCSGFNVLIGVWAPPNEDAVHIDLDDSWNHVYNPKTKHPYQFCIDCNKDVRLNVTNDTQEGERKGGQIL